MRRLLSTLLFIAIGVLIGGYTFRDVQPRSFLALDECGTSCYRSRDLAGLLASAGIRRAPGLLPLVLKESPRCITIRHPFPGAQTHFVIFPKRDIKDIGTIAADDSEFVMECLAHIRWLVTTYHLERYQVETNGPARQDVTYLHFHLLSSQATK